MAANSVRSELALAIRVVNLAYSMLTREQQERVALVDDGPLDAALLGGDRDRALAAIAAWRDRQLREIGRAAR
jgi:hypothetical protein